MKVITLWNGEIPKNVGDEIPKLTYYPTENKLGKGTVIMCPGGGYSHRASHEGKGYAEFLNEVGLDAFVLDYRVKPNRYPAALLDARYLQHHQFRQRWYGYCRTYTGRSRFND